MVRLPRWVSTDLGSRLGEVRVSGFLLPPRWPHLIDDETVAKMGHPIVVVRLNVATVPEVPT